ncbi:Mu-like prophage major head subunit gpT [Thalassovita litoralis]|uniref:Mu-like prophage major head subunit gpT n=1 Tax=Thalassovita litoralis TaxID=1010611 RepID=A0A521FS83_9RHOB|nr:Mu-like prophage major head subunit gpT family protein [Thalassovita litoralis]SMO98944.1 Mu-like prophage major head subunit gpT [Thalassovita litoralis]
MSRNKGLSSRAIIGNFYMALEAAVAASWVGDISMYFETDQESETYKWLGMAPAMREWVGGRHAKGFRENGITIENKKFEATLEVPVDWMRRDKTGQIMVRVNELAGRTVTHWQSLLSANIAGGETAVCYDGQYFFDTDHSEGQSGTQSNSITVDISAVPAQLHGTTSLPSPEEIRAMVLKGVEQILGFKDDQGEPMNEMARTFLVMVPTAWFTTAAAALNNPVVGGGDTNVMTNLDGYTFRLAVNPRLSWTDKLSVMRTDGSVKPFIRQEEEGVTVKAIAEGSELEFNEDKHHYGVKAIRNTGHGYWQHACLLQAV